MTLESQDPRLEDFSGLIGESVVLSAGGHRLMMTLAAAEALHGSVRDSGGFRLEFLGPAEPMLEQGIFPFEIAGERWDLFIVPLGRGAEGVRYEAVFY
jgi:hypothetical protein